jgi:glucose-6-phosphate 1-epimerase
MHRKKTIAESDRRLEIPGVAEILVGNGSLSKVRVTSAAAVGEIYMHGAHVTSWKPAGREEVFFVSSRSPWEDGRAIRGGVPISFPWFASKVDDPAAPAHGFVRTKAWQLDSISQEGSAITVSMSTESNDDTRRWSPSEFRLFYRASFGSELCLELAVANTGGTPLRFEEALHAYYRVGNIDETRVRGLNGVRYVDKTDSNREKTQQGEVKVIAETDRVYLNTSDAIELNDPTLERRIQVSKENSRTTVVWNPWREKARSMSDLGTDEWTQMICVETTNVSDYSVVLAPGQQHNMKSFVRVADF